MNGKGIGRREEEGGVMRKEEKNTLLNGAHPFFNSTAYMHGALETSRALRPPA